MSPIILDTWQTTGWLLADGIVVGLGLAIGASLWAALRSIPARLSPAKNTSQE